MTFMTDRDDLVEYIEELKEKIKELEVKFEKAIQFKIADDIAVEKRGENSWCVNVFGSVIDRDLNRHYEPSPSNRTDEFIAATRFSLEEAFDIAERYNQYES